jgi:uncharacterized protein involved in outer membrane biogenesis
VSEVEFCGGTVTGRIDVDLSEGIDKAKLAGKFSDIPIETCLDPLGLNVPLNGASNLRVDFSTTGSTYDELARGLAGPFRLKARRGSISVDLASLFAGSGALLGAGWSKENVTPFDELIAECRLGAGKIWCEKFNMKTEQGLVSGSGDIDLGQQTLNWRLFVANYAAPVNGSQLAAQTPPQVSISGAIAQPVIARAGQEPVHSGSVPTAARSTQISPR